MTIGDTAGSDAAAAQDNAVAAAEAAAAALPAVTPLIVGPAQPGSAHVADAFAGGAVAALDGVPGAVVVLIGEELVGALAGSPLGELDLSAAVQPAIDAAARALGAHARTATTLDLTADGELAAAVGGDFTTVPLIGAGIAAAVLVPQATLAGAKEPLGDEPAPEPEPAGLTDQPFVPAFGAAPGSLPPQRGLEMLHGVDMEVTVELGRTRMTVRDLLALTPGAVLELDRAAGSPADLLVNGRLVARGEVVVVDEDFGLRVTEIVDAAATA